MNLEDVLSNINRDFRKHTGFRSIDVSKSNPGTLVAYTKRGFCFDSEGTHEVFCSNEVMVMNLPNRIKKCSCPTCTGTKRFESKLPSLAVYENKLNEEHKNIIGFDKIVLRTFSSGLLRARSGFCLGMQGRHEVDFQDDIALNRFISRITVCKCYVCIKKHGKVYVGRQSEYFDHSLTEKTDVPENKTYEVILIDYKEKLSDKILELDDSELDLSLENRVRILNLIEETFEDYLKGMK